MTTPSSICTMQWAAQQNDCKKERASQSMQMQNPISNNIPTTYYPYPHIYLLFTKLCSMHIILSSLLEMEMLVPFKNFMFICLLSITYVHLLGPSHHLMSS